MCVKAENRMLTVVPSFTVTLLSKKGLNFLFLSDRSIQGIYCSYLLKISSSKKKSPYSSSIAQTIFSLYFSIIEIFHLDCLYRGINEKTLYLSQPCFPK